MSLVSSLNLLFIGAVGRLFEIGFEWNLGREKEERDVIISLKGMRKYTAAPADLILVWMNLDGGGIGSSAEIPI